MGCAPPGYGQRPCGVAGCPGVGPPGHWCGVEALTTAGRRHRTLVGGFPSVNHSVGAAGADSGIPSRAADELMSHTMPRSDQTVIYHLHELIAALDRRVPRQERARERGIADDARALRHAALIRIAELERAPAVSAMVPLDLV